MTMRELWQVYMMKVFTAKEMSSNSCLVWIEIATRKLSGNRLSHHHLPLSKRTLANFMCFTRSFLTFVAEVFTALL